MKPQQAVLTSQPEKVNAYMQSSTHALAPVAQALRQLILKTDNSIAEEIKWNAPAFFYKGEMEAFDPKAYKRHIIVFNFGKKDAVRLIFISGAKIKDTSGLLEGDYADGRRIATFTNMSEVAAKKKYLEKAIKTWLQLINK